MNPWDTAENAASLPDLDVYWLENAQVSKCFLGQNSGFKPENDDDLVAVDLLIASGRVVRVEPAASTDERLEPIFDMEGGQVWPCFVDLHTHIDKGHIWPRKPNPDGTFMGALESVGQDREARWTAEDVRARMDFSLRCAYAHGTRALRTHLDSSPPQHTISWPVFAALRDEWAGRIDLQAVTILGLEMMQPGIGDEIVDTVVAHQGILGAVTYPQDGMEERLRWMVAMADRYGLDLDFHVDETLDPDVLSLEAIAEVVSETGYSGTVTCGHCCSLSVQEEATLDRVLGKVAKANLSIVSLPMCNLYLQDRAADRTPRRRGVTLLHELKARGIRVSIASDNTRDPFYGYGDMDGLEVFTQAARIAHLDRPIGDWPLSITDTPAAVMGLEAPARIEANAPVDLVLFKGRGFSELLSRPQKDRIVLRDGKPIDTTLPDYRELDHLMEGGL